MIISKEVETVSTKSKDTETIPVPTKTDLECYKKNIPLDDAEIKKKLSPEQYKIMREAGTEMAFNNKYWNNKEEGIYVDALSGEPLFSSKDKFDSGTGWPSFTRTIHPAAVTLHEDRGLPGQTRTEVKSKISGSHLGHVFDDGPGPEGKRFCMNSASLRFIPRSKLAEEGYGAYLKLFQ